MIVRDMQGRAAAIAVVVAGWAAGCTLLPPGPWSGPGATPASSAPGTVLIGGKSPSALAPPWTLLPPNDVARGPEGLYGASGSGSTGGVGDGEFATAAPGQVGALLSQCPEITSLNKVCLLPEAKSDGSVELNVAVKSFGRMSVEVTIDGSNLVLSDEVKRAVLAPGTKRKMGTIRAKDPSLPLKYSFNQRSIQGDLDAVPDGSFYHLPYAAGASFKVVQGWYGDVTHQGLIAIDWAMPEGTPVLAAREGVVVAVVESFAVGSLDPALKFSANYVRVEHGDHTVGNYAHLKHDGAEVSPGQHVRAGDLLGYSGNTGNSSGPHLHFDVTTGKDLDPNHTVTSLFLAEPGATTGIELKTGTSYKAF